MHEWAAPLIDAVPDSWRPVPAYLASICDEHLAVTPLATGASRDMHGQVTLFDVYSDLVFKVVASDTCAYERFLQSGGAA